MNKTATTKSHEGSSWLAVEAISAVVGIDLGDKRSTYHVLDINGLNLGEGAVTMNPEALRMLFSGTRKMRIVMECGTHSPWVSRLLVELGHEVIVANPRRLRLISESDRKNDKADARLLAKLGQAAPDLLSPVQHRSEQVQYDLAIIKAREATVLSRARLVTAIRGIVKSVGGRLAVCSTGVFSKKALESCPVELLESIKPLLGIIEHLTQEIRRYDRLVARKAEQEYPHTGSILTIPGVGPLTALTFVLLLNNDANRFTRSRDLGCYFGLQPKQQDSGKYVSQLGITKAGDNLMRKLAVQCAHFMLGRFGKDTALRRWGLALALRGGKNAKKRAVVAVARKLLVVMHRLWKKQESFVAFPNGIIEPQAAA
jgi:transposase